MNAQQVPHCKQRRVTYLQKCRLKIADREWKMFHGELINILQWILTKLGTYLVLKRIWTLTFDLENQ
jgi:hypothetical protein